MGAMEFIYSLKDGRLLFGTAVLSLLLVLETWIPLLSGRTGRLRHGIRNVAMGLLNGVVTGVLFSTATLVVIDMAKKRGLGLLHWIVAPIWMETLLALLLFDLWMYLWHRANHGVPFLWRFHRMHHSDPMVDVTTALRFHLGELTFSSILRLWVVVLLGLGFRQLLLYEMALLPITRLHHSNVALPETWDRLLRGLIVTPNMHRVHHSDDPSETNSNYSSIFSFWDRLAKTFRLRDPLTLRYGLDEFQEKRWQTFQGMLTTPLK